MVQCAYVITDDMGFAMAKSSFKLRDGQMERGMRLVAIGAKMVFSDGDDNACSSR